MNKRTKAYKEAFARHAHATAAGQITVYDNSRVTRFKTRRESVSIMAELDTLPDHSLWNIANALPRVRDAQPRPQLIAAIVATLHGFYQGYEDARAYFTNHVEKLRELIADETETAVIEGAARASAF